MSDQKNEEGPVVLMEAMARLLQEVFDGYGFALMVFDWGDEDNPGGHVNYVSNAEREDMIKAMREFADVMEHDGGTKQ